MKASNLDLIVAMGLMLFIILGFYNFIGFILINILIIILLFNSNKSTVGVFLIWILFKSSALWSQIFGIPKAGLLCVIIALICFYSDKFNHRINIKKSFFSFLPIFLIFLCFFLLGPMHSYSYEKLIYIFYQGILSLIGFVILLNNPKINFLRISLLLLLTTFLNYIFVAISTNWSGVESLLDFGSLRSYYKTDYFELDGEMLINYQYIGLLGVLSFSFLLNLIPNKKSNKKNDIFFFVSIIISIFLVLYSGSRQSLYSLPIIYLIFLIINNRKSIMKRGILLFFGSIVSFFIISAISGNEESNLGLSEGTEIIEMVNRPNELLHAFILIDNSPWFGHGLGGFSEDTERYYPHNIFLEILSETGFLGLLLLLLYLTVFLFGKNFSLYQIANSGFLIFPVFLAIFTRANLSSDLIENISVLSFIIAWGSLRVLNNNNNNNNNNKNNSISNNKL